MLKEGEKGRKWAIANNLRNEYARGRVSALSTVRKWMLWYTMTVTASPVQFGVWIMALWFTSNGPAAYLTCASLTSDPITACTTHVAGAISVTVSLCHTLCHFISGLIGLAAFFRRSWAIAYAILGAIFYLAWGFLGVVGGEHIRHHLGVDVFGTWVHVVEGSILFGIWLGDRLSVRSDSRSEPSISSA
jgi:hypothetical protein